MDIRPKVRNAALVGALAAITATAWATNATISNATYVPDYRATEATRAMPADDAIAVEQTLSPNESVVAGDEAMAAPVVDRSVAQPGIRVEERRLTLDERIRADVMDKLASNPRLSGKIGVESKGAVVRLSGYTRTVGQAWHAERDARSVQGVKYVQNEIRARVGGSV